MRSRILTSLLLALFTLQTILTPAVHAQYTEGLPPGILGVEIDGQPIDSVAVPTTDNPSPRISGTVTLEAPTIELAVADGNVIRFPAEVNESGRFRASVPQALTDGQFSLYINDVLIGAFVVMGATPAERAPGRFLDIARMVPYPADFGEAIPGLGFLDGRFYTLEEEAVRTAAAADGAGESNERAFERRLAEAGWLQRYENRLAAPNPDDPQTFSAQISSFVVEYASGADARSAFSTVVGDEAGAEFSVIGDESVLTLLSGSTPDTGTEYQAARLVFRVGPMLGMIVYADLTNEPPVLSLLQTVAQVVAARGVFVADRQVVPLGSMALRLDRLTASENLRQQDVYNVRGGALTALYREDEASRASRAELLSGTTDAFSSMTSGVFVQGQGARSRPAGSNQSAQVQNASETPTSVIGIEGEEPVPEGPSTPESSEIQELPADSEDESTASASLASSLFAFPGESEAEAWMAAQRERLLAAITEGDTTFSEVTDSPALGDSTVAFASSQPIAGSDEVVDGYRIYTRTGAIVAVVDILSSPEISLRAAAGLMEEQLACIEAEGCAVPAALPGNLFGSRRDAADTSGGATPTAESANEDARSVITIEGDEGSAEASPEPREDRERRRDRANQDEAAASADPAG